MKLSLSLVKSILLFMRFRWDEISSRDELIPDQRTGMKFHPGMKSRKKAVNTSFQGEVKQWADFLSLWRIYIRSNLRVAQNGRFVITQYSFQIGPCLSKLWILGSLKTWKFLLQDVLLSMIILESWTLHCPCENFLEYPPNITIGVSIVVFLILLHFSWFKNFKLYWFSNSFLTLRSLMLKQ